jgi:hypothetical protein
MKVKYRYPGISAVDPDPDWIRIQWDPDPDSGG